MHGRFADAVTAMCLTLPAQVLEVGDGGATILLRGQRRRASTLVMPEVAAGDWVIVAAGTIVDRIDQAEAEELSAALDEAYGRGIRP
jgi:hydrogenase assembly chaperone HypC/HupF